MKNIYLNNLCEDLIFIDYNIYIYKILMEKIFMLQIISMLGVFKGKDGVVFVKIINRVQQ